MDNDQREQLLLAPYAMHAADSAGRVYAEPPHAYRSPYQRDRDRIVHSSAYRRLAHKTQVFTGSLMRGEGGDYHRTRLTHTHEVASVARTLARALALNEDLVEALALMHDIGHPPFGHAGEEVLDARLDDEGGFNHNAQALRIVERLEQRYADFPGLNLTRETLEGQGQRAAKGVAAGGNQASPLLEVQLVDAADSIAYDAHDADDALELGMLQLGDLDGVPLWSEAVAAVRSRHAGLSIDEFRRATIHELLDRQVSDLLRESQRRLAETGPQSTNEARLAPTLIAASAELSEQKRELERFLFDRVYRHPRVLAHRMEATAALGELFDQTAARAFELPPPLDAIARDQSPLRAAADYVSSVTDGLALEAARAAPVG